MRLTSVKRSPHEQGMQRGAPHTDGYTHSHTHTFACMLMDLRGVPTVATRSVHIHLLHVAHTHAHANTQRI